MIFANMKKHASELGKSKGYRKREREAVFPTPAHQNASPDFVSFKDYIK